MIDIYVQSEIFSVGRHPEDGEPMEGISFVVVGQLENGRRFAHKVQFESARCPECIAIQMSTAEDDFEGPSPRCEIHSKPGEEHLSCEEAQARAYKLADRVSGAAAAAAWNGPIGNPHWVEIRPAYGSQAWIDQGMDLQDCEAESEADETR